MRNKISNMTVTEKYNVGNTKGMSAFKFFFDIDDFVNYEFLLAYYGLCLLN